MTTRANSCEHPDAVARGRAAPGAAEILAWGAADDAAKVTSRRAKRLNALAENDVRPAHHAVAGRLETASEQIRPRKE